MLVLTNENDLPQLPPHCNFKRVLHFPLHTTMARTSSFDRPESDLALKDLATLLSRLQQNITQEFDSNVSPYELQKFKAVRHRHPHFAHC